MLSKLAKYDDLVRHYDHYCNQNSTKEFLEFVNNQEVIRQKWAASEVECVRLQNEVSTCQQEIARQERKIQDVRRHLEGKMEMVSKLEMENERLELRNSSARSLVNHYLSDPRISSDMRERLSNILAVLENGEVKGSQQAALMRSPGGGLDTISEGGDTDLSMTQSEDGLDVSGVRAGKKAKRQSMEQAQVVTKKARRSSTQQQLIDTPNYSGADKLIAKTVVSFPKGGGPVHAIASLETVPGGTSSKSSDAQIVMPVRPSAPPLPTSESDSDTSGWNGNELPAATKSQDSPTKYSPKFGGTMSSAGPATMRPHAYCQKTVIKPETCDPCGKRIKFSKLALKCRDCRATCHPECKDKVPLPCVLTGTPGSSTKTKAVGCIADYAPTTHPMVPGLIQHCVNEIEIRGFDTVGLYRVPGPEKEVKDLKDKFLRAKGIPNLNRYDIHAVCGCLKDFLRSLYEPLIGRWFWKDFAIASDINDRSQRQMEIDRIINDLPPSNQDSLAFVMLHLQRVAEVPEIKMPASNLAKVFGPTIVGYSAKDIDAHQMLKETRKQQVIVEALLGMPQEFWTRFICRQDVTSQSGGGTYTRAKARTLASQYSTPQSVVTLHNFSQVRDSGRKIYFTDDSPKETPRTRQKRNFFD